LALPARLAKARLTVGRFAALEKKRGYVQLLDVETER